MAVLSEPQDVLDTPTAARTAVHGSVLRTSAYLGGTLANALVLPFLFRDLGVVAAGRYVTVVSLVTILAGIVETGLTGISLRVYSIASPQRRPGLMRELISMRLAVLFLAITCVGTFVVAAGYPSLVIAGVGLGSFGVVLEGVGSSYNVWLSTNLRLGWIAISNVVRQLVAAGLTLMLIVVHAPLLAFFVVFIPAGAAQVLVSALSTRRSSPLTPSSNVRAWWPLMWTSLPYVFAMALGFVYFRVPVVMISMLGSPNETGLFGASFRLVETLTLMTIVITAAVPILTRAAHVDQARHVVGLTKMVQVSLVIGGALTVGTLSGANLAISLLAGRSFAKSAPLLQAMSPLLLLKFLTTAWGFGLLSIGRYRALLVANALVTAISVIVGASLIPVVGAYGGVASMLGAESALALAYWLILHRNLPAASVPVRTCAVVLLATGLSAATLALPASAWIHPALGLLVFAVVMCVGREVPPEAIELLPGHRGFTARFRKSAPV